MPPSPVGLVPLPHLGTAHVSHPFPRCSSRLLDLGSECSGRAGLSPGAGSESLPVSHSQPGLSRCLPAWFGASVGPGGGGQGGADLALGVLPGGGTFTRCHKVTHKHHSTHPVGGLATHCHHHGTGGTQGCMTLGAARLGWEQLWHGQPMAGALWELLLTRGWQHGVGSAQPALPLVCPSLYPQMSGWPGGTPGAPPSWPRGWRRSWRPTWPARCGRCRRSCGESRSA